MRTPGSRHTKVNLAVAALAAAAIVPLPAAAATNDLTTTPTSTTTTAVSSPSTTQIGTAHLVEWDLTLLPDQIDANPGAMVVDTRGEDRNQLWFVTRVATPDPDVAPDPSVSGQRVYRFNPAESLLKRDAQWTSWDLRFDSMAGGVKKIRPSHDRRYIFVRTASYVQRVDTQKCSYGSCERTVWSFPGEEVFPFVSDIAVDDQNRVFTTGISPAPSSFSDGYLQMLKPGAAPPLTTPPTSVNAPIGTVTRWHVGGAAGACVSQGPSTVCNSGIDIHHKNQYLVYYTEPGSNNIAELNIAITYPTASKPNVRRWSLDKLSAYVGESITQPRMLKVDRWGKVWVNTGSGHLVSLDPSTSRMTKHLIPGTANDSFGIAPDDDVIGYTGAGTNKVAMLLPKFTPIYVPPVPGVALFEDFPTVVVSEASQQVSGTVPGDPKIVQANTTRKNDGTFVEALINTGGNNSLSPLGITPNRGKAQGTFFYTVGLTPPGTGTNCGIDFCIAKRIGFARLPVKERIKNPRDDDDADDGRDRYTHPGWHNSEPGDDDADGVPDQYDSSSSSDGMRIDEPATVPIGQSADYPASTSATTLALLASVTADPTATFAVDVYNALGALVGTSGPLVGVGLATVPTPAVGTYTVKVRNVGATPITQTPTFVVREPWLTPQQ